jgi:SAM-dependent methyltransferase/ketosteroid isomerase-like protein
LDGHAPARAPEDLGEFFIERASAGDVEGLVALYEPDAVLAFAPGRVAVGHDEIRAAYRELLAGRPAFASGGQRPPLRNGDLALTSTRLPGGGTTVEVARRQPDGTWLWAIDQPSLLSSLAGNRSPRERPPAENRGVAEAWMLDELAHAGPEHLDVAFVSGYDKKQGYPGPDEDIAAFEARGLDRSSAIVDLGAGTGQFAVPAARRFGRVIAADVSPAMVAAARQKAEAAGLANLDCMRAGFLSYAHTGPPVDGVYTRNALHQVPDFWKGLALQRIADMLRPGGVLRLRDLIFDFQPEEAADVFRGWFAGAAADPAGGYTAADYAEHIRTEYSTYRWLFEPLLGATGFEIASVSFQRRLYGAYTCVKRSGMS